MYALDLWILHRVAAKGANHGHGGHVPTNQGRHFRFFQGANLIICVNSFLFSYFSAVQDSYFINTLTFQKIRGGGGQMPPAPPSPPNDVPATNWSQTRKNVKNILGREFYHLFAPLNDAYGWNVEKYAW